MANMRYFSDTAEAAVRLVAIWPMRNSEFASTFPGVTGLKSDGYAKLVGRADDGRVLPVTRVIEFKRQPSLHECNAKCLNGSCKGRCECRCGGRNHGRGALIASPAPTPNLYLIQRNA